MSGQGYHILLDCRQRSAALRVKGFSYDQIADVLALDHQVSPLRLYRYTHGRTAADVVAAFNDLDPAGTAAFREARLYDYEAGTRRPSGPALVRFARIYQTTARGLLTDRDYQGYGVRDRELIDAADYRHLDPRAYRDPPPHGRVEETEDAPETARGIQIHGCAAVLRAVNAQEADVNRREMLFELSLALGGLPALRLLSHLSPEEETRLAGAVAGHGRIDGQVIEAIEKLTARCWMQDDNLGPKEIVSVADAQRQTVARLLGSESLLPGLRDRLMAAHWALCHLSGWLHFDILDFPGAATRYQEGLDTAHQLGDATLLAHMHGSLAMLLVFQDKPTKALDHAFAAQGWVKKSPNRLQHAAAFVQLARVLATNRQANGSLRSLDRAIAVAQTADPADSGARHLYWCSPERIDRNRVFCLAESGRYDETLRAAEQTLTGAGAPEPRERGRVMLESAHALVEKREIAEAACRVRDAADIAATHSSGQLAHTLAATRRLLEPWTANRHVRDLDAHLHHLGLAT